MSEIVLVGDPLQAVSRVVISIDPPAPVAPEVSLDVAVDVDVLPVAVGSVPTSVLAPAPASVDPAAAVSVLVVVEPLVASVVPLVPVEAVPLIPLADMASW
jgi:hypothetical protein